MSCCIRVVRAPCAYRSSGRKLIISYPSTAALPTTVRAVDDTAIIVILLRQFFPLKSPQHNKYQYQYQYQHQYQNQNQPQSQNFSSSMKCYNSHTEKKSTPHLQKHNTRSAQGPRVMQGTSQQGSEKGQMCASRERAEQRRGSAMISVPSTILQTPPPSVEQ